MIFRYRSAAVLVACAAIVTTTVASADARRTTCGRAAGSTLTWDAGYRAFTTVVKSKTDSDANTTRLYACKSGRTTIRRLQTFHNNLDGMTQLTDADVVGHWLVVRYRWETGISEGFGAYRYDMNGKVALFTYSTDVMDGIGVKVVASYGTASGGMAFLNEGGAVTVFDGSGKRTLAASGASDLAVSGNRVYWTDADTKPQSTVLAGAAPSGSF